MKYNNTIELLKTVAQVIENPMSMLNNLGENPIIKYSRNPDSNNNMINNAYEESEDSNKEYGEIVSSEDSNSYENSDSYNDKKSVAYYNKQQDTSLNSQGVIDSIAQELTSVRLQQAIILSEIVGKPRSKTRKKRRF